MTQAVLADTGPLYAATDPDDQYHLRSHRDLEQFERNGTAIFIATSTVLECYTLVLRKLGIATAHEWVRNIRHGGSLIAPLVSDIDEAAVLVQRFPDQQITLVDATLAVLAQVERRPFGRTIIILM